MATIWYLWAIGDDQPTNEYIAKVVGDQYTEHEHKDKLCADGKRRNLFECPRGYDNVKSAISGISEYGLKLEVFKEDIEDVVVQYELWKKPVRKTARARKFLKGFGPKKI